MAGASFKMDLSPLVKAVEGMGRQMAASRAMMAEIGEALVASTRRRFKNEETPEGDEWPKSVRAATEGGQTLSDTGRLKNSIGYEATETAVAVGTNVHYAAIHQFGGEIKPKTAGRLHFKIGGQHRTPKKVNMPARPFIGVSKDDLAEAKEIMLEHLTKRLGK